VFQITNVASGNTQGTIQYQASGSTDFVLDNQGSGSGGVIAFMQAGSERMRIDSSGNLGIGTSSPAQKLDLGGAAQIFFSNPNAGNLISNNNYVNIGQLFSSGGPYMGYGAKGSTTVPSGYVSATTVGIGRAAIDLGEGGGGVFRVFTGASETTTVGSPLVNMVERMRLDSSGNLGIGTTSPADMLDVKGNARVGQGQIVADSTVSTFGIYAGVLASSGNAQLQFYGKSVSNTGATYELARISGGSFGTFGIDGGLSFSTALNNGSNVLTLSERMRLDASGNLGVGATSPSTYGKLAVNSTAAAGANVAITKENSGTANQNGQVLYFNNSHPSATARNANVVAGQIIWQFSQPSSGALQYAGEIAVLSDAQGGTSSASSLNLYSSGGRGLIIDSGTFVTMPAYGAGTATFSASGVISSVSDETWKVKDGVPTDPDIMLKKLEPGYWYYNEEKAPIFGAERQLGFYAQNVNAAIGPEAAPTPEEGKPWGYYDRSVLAITVMSLQKALATIETLTARITALETA